MLQSLHPILESLPPQALPLGLQNPIHLQILPLVVSIVRFVVQTRSHMQEQVSRSQIQTDRQHSNQRHAHKWHQKQ